MNSQAVPRRMLVILGIVSLLLLAGCGGGTSHSLNNQSPTPSGSNPPPSGPNPIPAITMVSPKSAMAGGAPFTLTIIGTNFVAGSMISFGGTARTTTFVSATQLTAAIPATAIALDGYAEVTVTNPPPGGGPADRVWFAVIGGTNPVPTINSLDSTEAPVGGQAFTLTAYGLNFVASSVVRWNGSDRPTTLVISWCCGPLLTAQIPASDLAAAGTVAVTVFNPAPGGGTSKARNLTIVGGANSGPMIDSLSPSCAPQGEQVLNPFVNGQLLVNGQDFLSSSVVRWNSNDRPTTFYSNRQLTAQISASDLAVAGTAEVTVFNSAPGGGSSNTSTFTVTTGGVGPRSIAVDQHSGKFAYVANEGCGNSAFGNVSMYTIDPTTGALASVGPPVASNDEGGRAVTVDPSAKFVYVANWGEGDTSGSVSVYTINATTGVLTSIGAIWGHGGLCAPWSVVVHPSGKFAYAANEGCAAPTNVSMFTIDTTTGALTPTGTIAAGDRAISVAVDPNGKFAYVTTQSDPPGSVGNVSMYTINAATGALTFIGTIAAGTNPASMLVDATGKFAYVTNSGSNDVSMYAINTSTGSLTTVGTVAAGAGPASVAVDHASKFAYVANSGSNDVSMYAINATGSLTSIGTIAAGSSPTSIAIEPSGKFAYVTNAGSNDVSMYSIDAATGALTLIGTIGT